MKWTAEEDAILRAYYLKVPTKEILQYLPGRTYKAVCKRANDLELTQPKVDANKRQNTLSRKEAIALLWDRANLTWKLDTTQKELYEFYHKIDSKVAVLLCSRRLGKSYLLCILAIEMCLTKPNAIVKYVAPEQKMVRTIIKPLIREIVKDCPPDIRPDFIASQNIYIFKNGSEIQLSGTDNGNHEKLRGGQADLCIVDEAGFCSELKYVVRSILLPTTTTTGGKIILSSTPPKSMDHEFVDYIKEASVKKNMIVKTIYDNPRIKPEVIADIVKEYGGEDSEDFQREYLCKLVHKSDNSVIPEFTEDLKTLIVREWEIPTHYDSYVAMDLGFKDLTVVLFGYYDFINAKLVIQDEVVMNGSKMTTAYLADKIREKETNLWTNKLTNEFKPPYRRVSDNNLIVINDLHKLHGILFAPTLKDDFESALNNTRMMLDQERIIISPKCKHLINHLEFATWDRTGKKLSRSADNGHYDALMSLVYMVRNIDYVKNPYPRGFKNMGNRSDLFINPSYVEPTGHENILNIFRRRR